MNERIRISPILLIDEEGQSEVIPTAEALRRAREVGLDLVEVAPNASPPVCKIIDFGKFKYDQSKKENATRARSKEAELKEVRLGRSMKIDPHDIGIRLQQARRFLLDGDKVQIVQNFRGREMAHRDRGDERMRNIIEQLSDIARVEVPPRMAGRRMTMIIAPDKAKIEQLQRRKDAPKSEGDQPAVAEETAAGERAEATSSANTPPGDSAPPKAPAKAKAKLPRTSPADAELQPTDLSG